MVNTTQSHNVLLKNVQNLTSIQNRQYLIVTASFPTEAAKKDPLKSKQTNPSFPKGTNFDLISEEEIQKVHDNE